MRLFIFYRKIHTLADEHYSEEQLTIEQILDLPMQISVPFAAVEETSAPIPHNTITNSTTGETANSHVGDISWCSV